VPFTPNDSEQRSPLTYYRGCWHVIGRGLFLAYRHHPGIPSQAYSSTRKGLYNLSAFIVHAASLRQAFAHCGRFLAAASRRSLGRISVPVWPVTLSGRLLIVALVGSYPTNKLISRRLISGRRRSAFPPFGAYSVLPCVSTGYSQSQGRFLRVTHPSAGLRHPKTPYPSTCMLKTRRQRSF
jgi:hypothetical protein